MLGGSGRLVSAVRFAAHLRPGMAPAAIRRQPANWPSSVSWWKRREALVKRIAHRVRRRSSTGIIRQTRTARGWS